ncbi:MAG: hypothetical protein PHT94_03270 [Candidatus Nanoarchaeia archaeon]|nr:hypothetical protein [Candidatus Nanoarchaeia archaeon]
MKKNIIILLFFTLLFISCSQGNQEELDSLFATNSGLEYSTILDINKESFEDEIDYNLYLNYADMKLYLDNSKHYVDRNLMFSLFFPKEYVVKVYDNQIIGNNDEMDIKVRIFSKEIYENSSLFFSDLFKIMEINESKQEELFLKITEEKFNVYNVSKVRFYIDDILFIQYLIDKEEYFFNLEFKINKNAVKQEFVSNYFYNTILLPLY